VRIQTITSLSNLKYEEWVAKNREYVDKESGGKLAYVHMRGMNQEALDRLIIELDQAWAKDGVVIDIRYNGGGNIDQQLFDVLSRKPYQFLTGRNSPPGWGRRPFHAIAGPKVMLINARSASNSEMTPEGFRALGLGRVVGNATAGAVIATGSYNLINGGSMRTPGSLVAIWDPTRPNNVGLNMENWGVPPDVFVKNSPEDELRGFDRELKAAIDEALRMMGDKKWQYTTTEAPSQSR
jgi:tricorn protease